MFKKITRGRLEVFLQKYASTEQTLDIGSGGSSYHRYFPNRLTVDMDPSRQPRVVADIHRLPFVDGKFKVILCTEVLEHVLEPSRAIAELHRVLAPGGLLVLSTRFVFPLHDAPGDYWRFTKYNLIRLFADWQLVELVPETGIFSALGVLLQRIAFQTKLWGGKPLKFCILLAALVLSRFDFLVRAEYGDIKKTSLEKNIMTTGYYLAARK